MAVQLPIGMEAGVSRCVFCLLNLPGLCTSWHEGGLSDWPGLQLELLTQVVFDLLRQLSIGQLMHAACHANFPKSFDSVLSCSLSTAVAESLFSSTQDVLPKLSDKLRTIRADASTVNTEGRRATAETQTDRRATGRTDAQSQSICQERWETDG